MTVVLVNILKTFFKCSRARNNLETKAKLLAHSSGQGCGVIIGYTKHIILDSNLQASKMLIYRTKRKKQNQKHKTLPFKQHFPFIVWC